MRSDTSLFFGEEDLVIALQRRQQPIGCLLYTSQEVRGKGLLIGVELTRLARPYCDALRDAGILAKDTHGTVVRFAPPLVVTKEQIDWAMERIEPILMNGH